MPKSQLISNENNSFVKKFFEYLNRNPEMPLEKCKKIIKKKQDIKVEVNMFTVPLRKPVFSKLNEKSKIFHTTPTKMARVLIQYGLTSDELIKKFLEVDKNS